jgi:ComF family protein
MPAARAAQRSAVAQYSNALKGCQPNLLRQVYGASKTLIHKLVPVSCLLCLDPGQPPALELCRDCEADLPRHVGGCVVCAAPGADAGVACPHCRAERPSFDRVLAPYRYEFPLAELVHRLKYGNQLAIGRLLGTLLARRIAEAGPTSVDALVPVPLHAAREARRGYNQAAEIARFAGELLALPVLDRVALRMRATEEQAGLPAIARRANVSGAFEALAGCVPASVAIVDDVLTTGATAGALAEALKRAGARRVEAWAVTRVSPDRAISPP